MSNSKDNWLRLIKMLMSSWERFKEFREHKNQMQCMIPEFELLQWVKQLKDILGTIRGYEYVLSGR